ncbi:hypothetical protein WN944_026325 [Citrus x changshan-huyou]|uniref:S-protein n=2 Tax=Citrus TaxID=2706 RepID=A0ACB8I2M6_CITSI|nr:S-protein [Citrus sinensis]
MTNPWLSSFLLFLALASCYVAQKPSSASSSHDENRIIRFNYKIHVINGFKTNKNPLIIHCYSNHDDLGEHTLWMNGEFKFHFRLSMIEETRFWCDWTWGTKKKSTDVFNMAVEYHNCFPTGNCFWKTAENGIYFSNDNTNWVKRYLWPFDHVN